jgi:predicted enzyme related to lactoylglutathione lyase
MEKPKFKHGQFCWTDMTSLQPEIVKPFYEQLFGWTSMDIPMKDGEDTYHDYAMAIDENTPGGGLCHTRGANAGIPPQWITYFYVENVSDSLDKCLAMGGTLIKSSPKKDGGYNFVIVSDPNGAVFGMVNM